MRVLTMVVSAELNNMKKLIITLMVSAAVAHAGNTDSFIEKIGGQGNGTLGAAANKGRGKSTVAVPTASTRTTTHTMAARQTRRLLRR